MGNLGEFYKMTCLYYLRHILNTFENWDYSSILCFSHRTRDHGWKNEVMNSRKVSNQLKIEEDFCSHIVSIIKNAISKNLCKQLKW